MIYYNARYDLIGTLYYDDLALMKTFYIIINEDAHGIMVFTPEWRYVGTI